MTTINVNEVELNGEVYVKKSSIQSSSLPDGDYVVIRSRDSGVHAGYIEGEAGEIVKLKNARRLWYWDGAATLSQVAGEGITKPENCKFPAAIAEITVIGVCEVIPCTKEAQKIIESVKVWKK